MSNPQKNHKLYKQILDTDSCNYLLSLLPKVPETPTKQIANLGKFGDFPNHHLNKWTSNDITKYRISLITNKKAWKFIKSKLKSILQDYVIENMYVTYYGVGNLCKIHSDPVNASAIILLNNKFSGGEFILEPEKIDLDVGDVLLFDNKDNLHGVKKVISGHRYALSIWLR